MQLQEAVLGKAISKSASLMKDMDELTKQARKLQAEIALPCFVCTHDHSKYLTMERYYYNKERTIVNASEETLLQVKSDLKQCQKKVEQERNNVTDAKTRLAQAETLLAANSYLFWRKKLGSEKDVNAARSTLERYKKDFQKAQSSLEEKEQEKLQAEIVLARLMHIISKQNAMNEYYYGKELKLNFGSNADLVTVKNSALQLCQEHVEQARTNVRSAEINLMDGSKMVVIVAGFGGCFYAVLGGRLMFIVSHMPSLLPIVFISMGSGAAVGSIIYLSGAVDRLLPIVSISMGSGVAVGSLKGHPRTVDRLRSELGRCKNIYRKAQHSMKFEQEIDAKIDTETCTTLKRHDCYYCNKEGQRLQNAAEVNQAIIAKKSALRQCQEQVEQTTTNVRSAENKLRQMMFVHVGVGAAISGVAKPGPTRA